MTYCIGLLLNDGLVMVADTRTNAGIDNFSSYKKLHTLAATRSPRQVLWLYGARDKQHHPFAAEVRRLMGALGHGSSWVCYSTPSSADATPGDYDATGHLTRAVLERVGIGLLMRHLPLR